ncbi:hypothetical protein BU15DRAFT_80874 [Melanogaster broomeanus]|nr:hypothetical protein BU15DRAFT_80874 [Melanogaster broomeanus]
MSSASKSITPAPSMPGINWARLKMPKLNLDLEDNNEVIMAKAKEHRQHKVVPKGSLKVAQMSDWLGELVQAQRESTQASKKATRALKTFVDEAAFFGMPEESADKSTEEEVGEGETQEELARLWDNVAENLMSPPKK